jgi:hypothetical protein
MEIQRATTQNTQISCAIKASNELVKNLHRDGLDRGCVATFNDYMVIRQVKIIILLDVEYSYMYLSFNMSFQFTFKSFTKDELSLYRSLNGLNNVVSGGTRLYDSMLDIVKTFQRNGDRSRPWILVVVTDGDDNRSSRSLKKCAEEISHLFTKDSSNFLFVVGVGDDVDSTKMEQVYHFLLFFFLYQDLLYLDEISHTSVIFPLKQGIILFRYLKSI